MKDMARVGPRCGPYSRPINSHAVVFAAVLRVRRMRQASLSRVYTCIPTPTSAGTAGANPASGDTTPWRMTGVKSRPLILHGVLSPDCHPWSAKIVRQTILFLLSLQGVARHNLWRNLLPLKDLQNLTRLA